MTPSFYQRQELSMFQTYSIADTFGIPAPGSLTIEGFPPDASFSVPAQKPYLFRKEHLRDLLAFLSHPSGDGLYLSGPTGSGKTSLIEQTASRLYWGVHSVTGHGRLEFQDLLGQFILTRDGSMQWREGPLSLCLKHGHILLINEIDAIDPSELIALNDLVEGKPVTIFQTGEVLQPHAMFRLIATGNSFGAGDSSGFYQGIVRQNLSFMDRFRLMEVHYPLPEDEMLLLKEYVPSMPEPVMENMIKVANQIRRVFLGGVDGPGMLSVTLSTRGLVRWALLTATFKSAPNALSYALDRSLCLRAQPAEREAIQRIARDIFAEDWTSES
jgi:cobaltochelatase CobS